MQQKPPYDVLIPTSFVFICGVLCELFMHPVQPISYVPGMAFLPLGVGIASALIMRKWRVPGMVVYGVGMVVTLLYIAKVGTTPFPLSLLVFGYGITKFLMFFNEE